GDVDLGSVGPAILPGDRIFQIGKEGVGYPLDAAHLGGVGGELVSARVCATAAFGGTAHTDDTVYVPCGDGVVAVRFTPDSLTVAWRSERFDAGPPILAGGLVWSVDESTPALVGLDPAGGARRVRIALDDASHFASPSSAPGCIFVPTLRTITAFCVPGASCPWRRAGPAPAACCGAVATGRSRSSSGIPAVRSSRGRTGECGPC